MSKKALDYGLNKPLYSNNGRRVDTLKGAHIASIEEKQLFLSSRHIVTVFISRKMNFISIAIIGHLSVFS